MKRILDILISLIALILLAPMLLVVMILLKFSGEGEVFYLQDRVGYKNQTFKIWKFATMLKNSPNMGTGSLTVRNDPRVTKVGKFLRMTKINELPQIVNVLRGNMSIVGPRPQMKVDFDVYPPEVKERIYNLKPGITSLGSIVYRDEEKIMSDSGRPIKEYYADTIAPHKGAVELWYQKKANVVNYIKIIFLTAWVIIFPDSQLVDRLFKGLPQNHVTE